MAKSGSKKIKTAPNGSAKNCTKITTNSLVKVEENKRKAVFRNPSRKDYQVSTVDGCLIEDGIRTDYLVSEVGVASVLIELKGSDVSHACDQLLSSVSNDKISKLLHYPIGFLVICSKYPRFDSFVAKAKTKAARLYNAGFHVVCNKGEFDIKRVVEIEGPF